MSTLQEPLRTESAYYGSEAFRSVAPLREYQAKLEHDTDCEPNEEIDFFLSMVETMDQLRVRAVELHEKKLRHRAQNGTGPLPLPWNEIAAALYSEEEKNEPPVRLISHLAENRLPIIETLLSNMRKVLHRERQMTPIARIQQMDSHCLRWYSRQPGITAAERAGKRQKLLSVVRVETYNTLENRVLKDFLRKSMVAARLYHQRYAMAYPRSKRIQAVQKMIALMHGALRSDLFFKLPVLHAVPAPNYVLQCDPLYRRVWRWYRLLIAQTRMGELIWPVRHVFTADFLKMAFCAYLRSHEDVLGKPLFHSDLWIRALPENGDGLLTDKAFYNNVFDKNGRITEIRGYGPFGMMLLDYGAWRELACHYEPGCIHMRCGSSDMEFKGSRSLEENFNTLAGLIC